MSNAAPACVFVFDDRIEMWNAGEMPKDLSLDKLQSGNYTPSARNPLLENLGSGLQKVCRLLTGAGLPLPAIEAMASGTRIVVRSENREKVLEKVPEKVPEKVTVKVPGKVTANQTRILLELTSTPRITTKELACIIGISERKIKENISKLKAKALVKRIGPDKGGHWEVVV
ncbi:MAG: winged helix-turn-helix transcriptional regulator [Elusimicrobia bacterium]|nr:winged helix-turn-helix transcriptional regulator [Elusimicrobiota bacterium]